jgi:hypothetical protein
MIPSLHRTTHLMRRDSDGQRRPRLAAVERLEAVVETLCAGTGVVTLYLDAVDLEQQIIVRTGHGRWEYHGPVLRTGSCKTAAPSATRSAGTTAPSWPSKTRTTT